MISYDVYDFKRALSTIFYAKWYVVADIVCSFIGSLNYRLEFIEDWWDNIRYNTYVYLYRNTSSSSSDEFDAIVVFKKKLNASSAFEMKFSSEFIKFLYDNKIEVRQPYGCTDISYRYASNRDVSTKEYKCAKKCISEKKRVYVVDLIHKKDGRYIKILDKYGLKTFEYFVSK